jgi:AcrR family transcriptional regulator
MPANNATHQQILDTAEALFATRGYNSVRLRDIAEVVGVKHAALYYYVPGGKEQLFMDVMIRGLQRHQRGMEAAIAAAGPDLRAQMHAVAAWLLSQPPINIARMEASDFPAIAASHAATLSALLFEALRQPLQTALEQAQQAGDVTIPNPGLAAISFTSLINTFHAYVMKAPSDPTHAALVIDQMIDMLLYGWLKR